MKYTYLLFLAMFASISLCAQEDPVNWSYFSEKTGTDEYTITYSADVKPGWYIYSQHTDPGGPIPTAFYVTDETIELVGDAAEEGKKKEGMDDLFGVNVIKFSGLVLFRQKIKAKAGTNVAGYLEFMACDNEQCLPPKEVEFDIVLE